MVKFDQSAGVSDAVSSTTASLQQLQAHLDAATSRFDEAFEEARELYPCSLSDAAQKTLVKLLGQLQDRSAIEAELLRSAIEALPSSTDIDRAQAYLAGLEAHAQRSSVLFSRLGGLVISLMREVNFDEPRDLSQAPARSLQ